jgi:hypothetical protein
MRSMWRNAAWCCIARMACGRIERPPRTISGVRKEEQLFTSKIPIHLEGFFI